MNTRVTNSTVGSVLAILAVVLLTPYSAVAGGRPRVVAVSRPSSSLELTFIGGGGPVVDAGAMVWRGGSRPVTVSRRTVTMRIGEPSREARGTATVRAFVETLHSSCTVRIDGIALTNTPRVIRRHAPIGVAATYRIEIEVPVNAPDGLLLTNIGWEVTSE